ncbi:hypothetical protein D029_4786B, partial [Vibrio parahaemolyticus 970107]
ESLTWKNFAMLIKNQVQNREVEHIHLKRCIKNSYYHMVQRKRLQQWWATENLQIVLLFQLATSQWTIFLQANYVRY